MPLFKRPVETIVKSGGTPIAGDITLIDNGNITISQILGSFSFSAGGGAGGGIVLAASNTTYTSGTVTVTGVGGGVTVGSNTGQRIDISVAAPVAQTAQTQSNIQALVPLGNTAGTTGSIQTGTVGFAGGANITISQSSGTASTNFTIIGPSQSVQTQLIAGIAASNTTYTSGTVSFTGVGGGITVSSNTGQRVDFSVAAPVAQTVQTQNLFALTLSSNTSGALALISSGTMTLAGGNNITLSQAGNAVTISGAAAGAAANLAVWHNAAGTLGSTGTSNGTFWIFPLDPDDAVFPGNMTASTAYIAVSASSNISNAYSHTLRLGIYTINGVSLSLLNSVSNTVGFAANANNSQAIIGARFITFHSSAWSAQPTFSQTKYYVGAIFHTSGTQMNLSFIGARYIQSSQMSGTFGNSITSGNTSMGMVPWVGVSNASRSNTAALPTNIQISELQKGGGLYGFLPFILFNTVSSNF